MNNKLFIFAAGAIIGSVVTWAFVKTKYENLANEEIEEVRELYRKKSEDSQESEGEDDDCYEPTAEDISELRAKLEKNGYVNYSKKEEKEDDNVREPYVISPEDFDDHEDYDVVSLTYYADDVLTDERDNVIEHPEDLVGYDWASHFGEYEDDSVFIRNDEKMTDYEILADTRKYSEIHR